MTARNSPGRRWVWWMVLAAFGLAGCAGGAPARRPDPGPQVPPPRASEPPVVPPEAPSPPPATPPPAPEPAAPDSLGARVADAARSQAGVPYRYGGNSPEAGFDCSGLAQWAYRQAGVSIPRTARDQRQTGRPIAPEGLAAGDLVFFDGKGGGGLHVGVHAGAGTMVHSPKTGEVVREERLEGNWQRRFLEARRVVDD